MSSESLDLSVQATGQAAEEIVPGGRRRSRWATIGFLLPAFLAQLIWGIYPLLVSFIMSFTDAQSTLPSKFTGFQSYVRVWRDPLVLQAFQVTFTYAILSVALTFLTPIIVAILLLEMPPKVMRWMMLLWFLPLSGIASTVLWRYVYDTHFGMFQYLATHILHLPEQQFMNDPKQVIFWLIFPGFLLFGPGLIYMAALQSIPASYYEAAEVEGAGFFRKMWTISFPRIRPMIAMLLIFAIISSLQEFAWPQIMTGGDPGGASRTVVMYMYQYIGDQRYADATVISIMLFLVTMALIVLLRIFFREDPDA